MPVLRYFLFVGGALLALLLGANALLPQEAPAVGSLASSVELPTIRIHSDRKWPERVMFDTSQPMIAAVAVARPDVAVAAASPKARVREAFAQLPLSEQIPAVAPVEPKKPEVKPQPKRKLVKARPVQQPIQQPVMLVAQFGLFGNTW